MTLSNIEKAKYEIAIDREKSKLLLSRDYKTQRSLTILFAVIGISVAPISFPSCILFVGAALFFAVRWKSMEQTHLEAQEKIQRYQYFLNVQPSKGAE